MPRHLIAALVAALVVSGAAVATAAPETTYTLVEATSGHVLGATGSGGDPVMTIDPYAGDRRQLWRIVDLGDGFRRIVNDGNGKSLSTVNGGSGDGAVVHLWDYLGGYPDQQWRIDDAGGGTATIANRGTGERLMSTKDGRTAAGTETQLWSRANGRTGQTWKLVPTALVRELTVHADQVVSQVPRTHVAAGLEDVNHEIYGGLYSQMVFGEAFAEPAYDPGVSGMWRATSRGGARGEYSLDTSAPFKGKQSQRIRFASGRGGVGVENRGLNRQGLGLVAGKPYEGTIVLRTDQTVAVALENADGSETYARTEVRASGAGWRTSTFTLTPNAADAHGRLVVELTRPGTADIGHVFLEPGAWGRFQGQHARKDVVDAMVRQGLRAIRFGGCANSGCGDVSEYRWKSMIGDPVHRPVTKGFWYPYESNGWGIFEFLQLGEAMGIEAVPSLNIDETPQDVADLLQYLYGPAGSTWGARRVADGHPAPYAVRRIQLGNENAVDEEYWRKFKALADVVWTYDPTIRLVVGDFSYSDVIVDPYDFTGGGKVNTLAAHRKILDLSKAYGAVVDFDIHLWTQQTDGVESQIRALDSYVDQLGRISPGADYHVVVFELNADRHDLARALANAYTINALQRRPKVDVVSSANALQVDGQNDNGWNQGLLFLNQNQVWGQPPYHVHRMKADSWLPDVVRADLTGGDALVNATALASADGRQLSIDVVNATGVPLTYTVRLDGFRADTAAVTTLDGRPNGVNTAGNPDNVVPHDSTARLTGGTTLTYTFPANSYTSLRLRG
ncbi:RICIN domain-containing protein [Umezawaea endophytica]|uniref:non-reducing end alpha-L-arabinofuranosidase n=1 Tax=Umezawaea endophytica TaxID=1654476 RepID=A0A9X2VFR0_9PSEU|nr:RICIN domain-containing protein [Umezawaea endophytica]MCS7475632.1 RICIN domain-containing protein [Umezawaea endophytica]